MIVTNMINCLKNMQNIHQKWLKKKSLDIKDKTSTKFDEGKKKFKKLNLKKKLLKFKNSKSQKEFLEN